MAWQKRGSHYYYYRSTKHRGKVTTDYLGSGSRAQQAALEDRERHAACLQERSEQQAWDALETHITTLNRFTTSLSQALLVDAGFYKHRRGEWRKRRTNGTHLTDLSSES